MYKFVIVCLINFIYVSVSLFELCKLCDVTYSEACARSSFVYFYAYTLVVGNRRLWFLVLLFTLIYSCFIHMVFIEIKDKKFVFNFCFIYYAELFNVSKFLRL